MQTIGHVRYINGSEAFESKLQLLTFFQLSIPKVDLDTKKTRPNIEVCPESLRAMLEYTSNVAYPTAMSKPKTAFI